MASPVHCETPNTLKAPTRVTGPDPGCGQKPYTKFSKGPLVAVGGGTALRVEGRGWRAEGGNAGKGREGGCVENLAPRRRELSGRGRSAPARVLGRRAQFARGSDQVGGSRTRRARFQPGLRIPGERRRKGRRRPFLLIESGRAGWGRRRPLAFSFPILCRCSQSAFSPLALGAPRARFFLLYHVLSFFSSSPSHNCVAAGGGLRDFVDYRQVLPKCRKL